MLIQVQGERKAWFVADIDTQNVVQSGLVVTGVLCLFRVEIHTTVLIIM